MDLGLTQINTQVRNSDNNIVEGDEIQENINDDYNPKQRFYLAGFTLSIVITLSVVIAEAGNYALTTLKYAHPINFRMYVLFIQLPFVFMFLGYYHLMGYGLVQKIKKIGLEACIFGLGFGICCALFALTIRDLSPHFLMLIDCIDLPIEFVLLVMFLGYKFNIWKAITVTAATGTIIVCSVMMTIYFNENPENLQSKKQNTLEGIIISVILNSISVIGDIVLFTYRERYFGNVRPLLDTALFFMLVLPASTLTLICCCAIASEPFNFPEDPNLWGCVAIYAFCELPALVLSMYLIYLMDPIYLRIGGLCRIPIIFTLDYIVRHITVYPVEYIGGAVLILSIVGYECASWYEKEDQHENRILAERSNVDLGEIPQNDDKEKEEDAGVMPITRKTKTKK